eukprot:3923195-Pyramimonas_sp.AAC.1
MKWVQWVISTQSTEHATEHIAQLHIAHKTKGWQGIWHDLRHAEAIRNLQAFFVACFAALGSRSLGPVALTTQRNNWGEN